MNGNSDDLTVVTQVSQTKLLMKKEHPAEILSQLNQFRLVNQYTDAMLVVDQEELHCHRCVLAGSSPYFQAIFSSNFQEAINAQVTLHDISPWIMKRILDYIYTGQLEISIDTAQDYLKTGHMLHYPDIVQTCCELLTEHLHHTNCLGIKEFAGLYGCHDLELESYRFALEHFVDIIDKSEELLQLTSQSLADYLNNDYIDIPKEILLWKAIKRWTLHDYDHRKDQVAELVSCLRFSALDTNDINLLKQDNLIKCQSECQKLLDAAGYTDLTNKSEYSIKTLSTKSTTPESQRNPRPSTLPRRVLVMLGGQVVYEISDIFVYDPIKSKWKKLASLMDKVVKASVTSTDEAIFVTGGIVNNLLCNKVWKFCCKEKKWTNEPDMLQPRAHHSSAILNDVLYVAGGLGVDNSQSVVPMTEIHAFTITTRSWSRVGFSSSPKMQAVLLGFNNTLYELGGLSDGCYVNTMETYILNTPGGHLKNTGEHYVLPCKGEPGLLRAVLDESDVIYILWENSGQLFSLNTNGRRFYELQPMKNNSSSCLAVQDAKIYILGGSVDGRPSPEGIVYHTNSNSWSSIDMPKDCFLHTCVQTVM